MTDQPEAQFGSPDCTCIPWTRQDGEPRYLGPGDTVDQISGWEPGGDCPHHKPVPTGQETWGPDTQTGVLTPGCDCGHKGMGANWHPSDCAWRAFVSAPVAKPDHPARLGPIDYARQQEAEREAAAVQGWAPHMDAYAKNFTTPAPTGLREQSAPVDWQAIVTQRERELKTEGERRHQAEAAIARVRAFLDQDQDGLCCSHVTGHIRRALNPQEQP